MLRPSQTRRLLKLLLTVALVATALPPVGAALIPDEQKGGELPTSDSPKGGFAISSIAHQPMTEVAVGCVEAKTFDLPSVVSVTFNLPPAVKPGARLMLLYISAQQMRHGDAVQLRAREIARACGVTSRTTISKYAKELESLGILDVDRGDRNGQDGHANCYRVKPLDQWLLDERTIEMA